jgi:HEPN domain-containing protein
MDNAKQELIALWFAKAESDLYTARLVAAQIVAYKDIVGFHCQQCAEKYLKAFLIYLDTPFPRTHDLERLLVLLENHTDIPDDIQEAAIYIDDFSVEVRYPLGRVDITEIDMQKSLEAANLIKNWVITHINT